MLKNAEFIDKLRSSGLRPTKQRLKICEVLFNREKTFHFTINDLAKSISEQLNEKISLATVYNTVHAFKDKGYLKEISINSDKSYFDTNITNHHHFFDEETNQLIDCGKDDIEKINVLKNITGKKIKSIELGIKDSKSSFSFFKDGFLVAGLIPKAIIFFGTIFSSFIDFSSDYISQFIILMITYVTLDFITLMIYGFAAEKVSVWLKGKPKILNTISACVLIIIAIYIAVTQSY